jgi:hypothetical protein
VGKHPILQNSRDIGKYCAPNAALAASFNPYSDSEFNGFALEAIIKPIDRNEAVILVGGGFGGMRQVEYSR